MSTTFNIRRAKKEDFRGIQSMIQELADFEQMSNGPKLSVDDLIRDAGFDINGNNQQQQQLESPLFFCFVAEATALNTINNDATASAVAAAAAIAADDEPLTRTLVGYALCFFTYSTWEGKTLFMEDIYVKPMYRNKGIGKQLFEEVIQCGQMERCKRLDFHVLKWNPATEFYRKMGAVNLTETEDWHFYRLQIN